MTHKNGSGFGQWRRVVERTFAWLNQFRSLRVRYDKRADINRVFSPRLNVDLLAVAARSLDDGLKLEAEGRASRPPGWIDKYSATTRESSFMQPFGGPGRQGIAERSMRARVADAVFPIAGRFEYEYDFGSTTTLQLTVVAERIGRIGRPAARLPARNTGPVWPCAVCGQPATVVCTYCLGDERSAVACAQHARQHQCGETEGLLPVVNSPRMGMCGYGVET